MEESSHVLRDRRWLLSWGEVPAARKNCPALDVVHALHIRAWWLTLRNSLVREYTKCCRCVDVGGLDWVPATVPIVAHRRGDRLRHPVQGESGTKEVIRRRDVAPRVPLLTQVRGQPHWGVVEAIANCLRLGRLNRAVAALRRIPAAGHRQIRTLDIGELRVIHRGCEVRLQCGEMDPDHRLGMVERKECGHPCPKVVAARSIAGIPELGHELMPALRHVAIIDADLGWTRRKSISGQGRYDYVEVAEHRQHVHIVEETARPAVRKDKRYTVAGCRTLAHE